MRRPTDLHAWEVYQESAKRFWDKQVQLYLDAAEAAATVAASDDPDMVRKARNRFWTLYWGSLAAVEDVGLNRKRPGDKETPIESAMVELGKRISGKVKCERAELQQFVLQLSHAIRDTIRPAFAGDANASTILGVVDKDMSQGENP